MSFGNKGREKLEKDEEEEQKGFMDTSIVCFRLTIHHKASCQKMGKVEVKRNHDSSGQGLNSQWTCPCGLSFTRPFS